MFDIQDRLNNSENSITDLANCVQEMFNTVMVEYSGIETELIEILDFLLPYSNDKKIASEFEKIIDAHLYKEGVA